MRESIVQHNANRTKGCRPTIRGLHAFKATKRIEKLKNIAQNQFQLFFFGYLHACAWLHSSSRCFWQTKNKYTVQCHHFKWAKWGKIVNVFVSRTETWILKKHFWLMMCSFIILCAVAIAAVGCRLSAVGCRLLDVGLCVRAFICHRNGKEQKIVRNWAFLWIVSAVVVVKLIRLLVGRWTLLAQRARNN